MSAPVIATAADFVPPSIAETREDLYALIAQLEFSKKMYEPDVAYYGEKIREYEAYLSLVSGRYWEDDSVNRYEAKRRHQNYLLYKGAYPEILEIYNSITCELTLAYAKLEATMA
jgi:hypothetical protein